MYTDSEEKRQVVLDGEIDDDRDLAPDADDADEPCETPSRTAAPKSAGSGWRVRKTNYTVSGGQMTCLVAVVVLVAICLLASLVFFVAAADTLWKEPETDVRDDENETMTGGVLGDKDATHPFADADEGNGLIEWAPDDVLKVIKTGTTSKYVALVDCSKKQVIASHYAETKMNPASMTKVMTLIVVAENLPERDSLDVLLTVSDDTFDAMTEAGSSGVGMKAGDKLTVESMMYALMLKSDGMAALELANYIAGSEEAFVELMNSKAEEMGLQNTHFVNPTGLHDDDHYSTCRDIASIMNYAMSMSLCREIMTTASFNAPVSDADGFSFTYYLYNNLLETKQNELGAGNFHPDGFEVVAGKTGFTDEAGTCLVTYAEREDGSAYICVTAGAKSYNESIADYIYIYENYAGS